MPWIIGIDEAGYGPNLGPLVMTSVACRVPEELARADLWKVLKHAVRRQPADDDDRLLIADSKVVYTPARGLGDLETSVLATLSGLADDLETLDPLVHWISPGSDHQLGAEPWYTGTSALPVVARREAIETAAIRFHKCGAENGLVWGVVRSVVVCPRGFNHSLSQWGSKAAVLAEGLARLLDWNRQAGTTNEPLLIFIDKHGGRNCYAAMLQHAFADGCVFAQREGATRSIYRVLGLERDVRLTIVPRADSTYFCVALASMVSKYLRELLMLEFNGFWQRHVPGLKPTAGYPTDAVRFYEDIRAAAARLGIAEVSLWRRR